MSAVAPLAPAPKRGFTVPGLRWWIAGLLLLITVIYYFDRAALGVLGPTLRTELQMDEVSFSYVVIAFQISYGAMQPVAGRLIDWLGQRLGYSLSIVFWGVVQLVTGFASGWRSLAMFRGLLGVGESAVFPGAIKAVSQWFPAKERTIATGILNMGSGLGALLAPPVVTAIILYYDWRWTFVFSGVLAFVWVLVWQAVYRPPREHKWVSSKELQHIERDPVQTVVGASWRTVVRERSFWALALARFLSEPAWQLFTYWIPFYLVTERHLDIKQVAYFAWVPFLAGDLGCLFGGVLSPAFMRLGLPMLTARKAAVTVPALLMTLSFFTGSVPSVEMAIAIFSIGAFAHQAISSTLLTLPADILPREVVATANGLSGTAGYAGGILFTFAVGRVAKEVGYEPLFACIAFFDLLGAAALWFLIREKKV